MQHKYVHLGSSSFDKTLFQPIKNISGFTKPTGGFWGSPVNSDYGWGEWVKSNNFDELIGSNKYEKEKFYFKLKPNTRLLYINKASMLRDLPKQEDEFTLACSSFIVPEATPSNAAAKPPALKPAISIAIAKSSDE